MVRIDLTQHLCGREELVPSQAPPPLLTTIFLAPAQTRRLLAGLWERRLAVGVGAPSGTKDSKQHSEFAHTFIRITRVQREGGGTSGGGAQEYRNGEAALHRHRGGLAGAAGKGDGWRKSEGLGRTGWQQSPPRPQQPSPLRDQGCPLHTARGGG